MPKFKEGDRVVHRSQKLGTLNTIEWVVYAAGKGEAYDPPRPEVWCRAIVVELSMAGVSGPRMLDETFYEWELKMATKEES